MEPPKEPKFLPDSQDLKSILEHVRGQFQYHAGQRLNTIRFFFLAYAVFVAAYFSSSTGKVELPSYAQLILSLTALVVTLGFWGLDVRNVQMVHIDEHGLEEIEERVAKAYDFKKFEMTKQWNGATTKFFGKHWSCFRYQHIMKYIFLWFALLSLLAVLRDLARVLGCTI